MALIVALVCALAFGVSIARAQDVAHPAPVTSAPGISPTGAAVATQSPTPSGEAAVAGTTAASTAVTLPSAADDALTARLKHLETELRCLVCQNQTLADSDAALAADLRQEVRELAVAGKTDDQIRAYLTARYGDFVLYNPPVKTTTWALWFGPFALLLGGAVGWWFILRRRNAEVAVASSADDAAEARGRNKLDR